jgi:hypothetical protein
MLNSAGTAPDGTNTAMLATDNSGNRSTLGTGTFTYSFFVKQGTSSTVRLVWAGYGGIDWTFTFATQSLAVSGAWSNASVARYPNGWYRISATTSSKDLYYYLLFADSASSTFYLWGCQGEAGSFPTSYIPTVASTVTRAADIASITGTNFSSWYNNTEGTVFTDFRLEADRNGTRWAAQIGPTALTGPNSNVIGKVDTNLAYAETRDGSATQYSASRTFPSSRRARISYAIKNLSHQAAFDGVLATSGTGTLGTPSNTVLLLGRNVASTEILCGTIARLTYYPVRLSNITLQALTTLGPVSSFPYSFSIKGRDILALKEVNKTSTRDFVFIKGLLSKVQPRINTASQYTSSGVVLRNAAMLKVAPTTVGNYFFSFGLTLSGATVQINGTNALSIATSPFSSSTATVPLLFAGLRPQANWRITEPMTSGTVVSPESAIPIETSDFLLFIKAGQS